VKDVLDETQRERDEELARYLGIPVSGVEACPVEKMGPPVHDGTDFRARSYCYLYEQYGRKNPATVLRTTSTHNVVKRRGLVRGLENHLGSARGTMVLDFGCGPGGHGIHFLQAGARVDFLDVDGPVYEYARWRVRERKLSTLARFLRPDDRLPPTYYDAVVCADVLEHTADPVREYKRILAAMRSDAVILLQFGNYLNPQQGHFKQSKERWWCKKTRRLLERTLSPLEPGRYCYYFKKRGVS